MPVYNSTKFKSLPQQVLENQKKIKVLEDNETSVDDKIDKNQKGQPLGVAELDASGKVPASQLPVNPGNFLEKTGGTMEGNIQLDGNTIGGASVVQTYLNVTEELGSSLGDLKVLNPIKMNNHKIKETAKGTSTDDVATIDNINDHNASPFAHADLRAKVDALNGTYIILGKIDSPTSGVNETNLNARVFELKARLPMLGDVLIDNDDNEHYYNGTNWDNLGQFIIELATASSDGLLAKEDFVKIQNQYDKAYIDSTFGTVNTQLYNDQVRMANIEVSVTTKASNSDVQGGFNDVANNISNLKDYVDDTKEIKSLDQKLEMLGNKSFNEYFQAEQLVTNDDFSDGTNNFTPVSSTINVNDGILDFLASANGGGIRYQNQTIVNTNKYYSIAKVKSTSNLVRVVGVNGSTPFQTLFNSSFHSGGNTYENISTLWISNLDISTFSLRVADIRTSVWDLVYIDYIYHFNISTLIANKQYSPLFNTTFDLMTDGEIKAQMDYIVKMYENLKSYSLTNYISQLAPIKQEAWLTPTVTNGVGTYFKYRKNNFGTIEFSGQITANSLTLNPSFTLPVGYRPNNVPYVIQLTQGAIMDAELGIIYTSVTLVVLTSGVATIYTTKTVDSLQTYVYTYGKFETE